MVVENFYYITSLQLFLKSSPALAETIRSCSPRLSQNTTRPLCPNSFSRLHFLLSPPPNVLLKILNEVVCHYPQQMQPQAKGCFPRQDLFVQECVLGQPDLCSLHLPHHLRYDCKSSPPISTSFDFRASDSTSVLKSVFWHYFQRLSVHPYFLLKEEFQDHDSWALINKEMLIFSSDLCWIWWVI